MAEPTPPASKPAPTGTPDRQALVHAFQDVVRSEQEKKMGDMHPVAPTSRTFQAVMLLLAVACAVVLVLQPSWLFPRAPEESPALRDASLRVHMFVVADRIDQYKREKGNYPASLMEAGADTTGVTYVPTATGYTLTGRDHSLSLSYSSTMPAKDFLGNSYSVISQRTRR